MNAVQSPEGQELQNLGSEAWDNPTYSGPLSPHGTLRICTISSAVTPQPQARKPEDRPQEKAPRTLVSTCCLQICRGIRGSWWGRVFLGYWSQGKEGVTQNFFVGGKWSEEEVDSHFSWRFVNCLC